MLQLSFSEKIFNFLINDQHYKYFITFLKEAWTLFGISFERKVVWRMCIEEPLSKRYK